MNALFRSLLYCAFTVACFQQASGIVLSYYRFEVDNDPGLGLSTPDELSGFALVADSATVDDSANPGSLPPFFEPVDGSGNNASLDGLAGPSGDPDIDATAAYNSVLDVAEMTVELYARTEESTAVLVARSTTSDVLLSVADGFRIYDPAALTVDFWTYDGSGGTPVLHTISTAYGLDDLSPIAGEATWRHVAFSFGDGVGRLYLDTEEIGSVSVNSGDELYWGAGSELHVGVAMDGFDFSKTADDNGYLDELRFSQGALDTGNLLPSVPEPRSYALILGVGACFVVLRGRRRSR